MGRSWDRERFNQLCERIPCLPEELAALANLDPKEWPRWYNAGVFPPHASLIFSYLDQFYSERITGCASEPLIPLHLLPLEQRRGIRPAEHIGERHD